MKNTELWFVSFLFAVLSFLVVSDLTASVNFFDYQLNWREVFASFRNVFSPWEKSPLLIGLAAFGLIVAIAGRGTERR